MTLETFLDAMAEIGIDGAELTSYYFPQPVTYGYIRRLARRAFVLGLDIAGTAVGNTFALPPGAERSRQIDLVNRWIEHAVDMGAPCVRVFAGAAPPGIPDDEARGWVIACLHTCLQRAEERGVMLSLENHGGVVATAEGMLQVLNEISSEWLGVHLDTGNFRTADPYADLALCAPYALAVHLKTDVVMADGRAPVDLPRVVGLLRECGYRGYVNLEYEGAEDPLEAVPRALRSLMHLTLQA